MKTSILRKSIASLSLLFFCALSVYSFNKTILFPTGLNACGNYLQPKIIITKTSTLEDLERIKNQMEAEGLGFKYSNVKYNAKAEIIAITISYKDKNNNAGTYSVSSEKPINDIVITTEEDRISVKSTGNSNQAIIQQGNDDRQTFEAESPVQRRDEMKREMERRQKEIEEKMAAMRAEMEQRSRDRIAKNQMEFSGKENRITKNATDEQLSTLQKNYEAENIILDFKNLKRNEKGEITYLSISVDNSNGSLSASSFGNGETPINEITLIVDSQHTIMTMKE